MPFTVKFWGVRGSIACASPQYVKYGGNTSCIEVNLGDRHFVLDAGTGIRELGREFLSDDVCEAHMLLTHTHWDHINGFPFFAPAFDAKRTVHIMAGHLTGGVGIQDVLASQMTHPTFPVPLDAMKANLRFEDFKAGEAFQLYPDVKVKTAPLNHPNGATGYRIEYGGKAACYVTDTEHVPGKPDDSFEHEAWNHSGAERVVLIVDFWHPELTPCERQAVAMINGMSDRYEKFRRQVQNRLREAEAGPAGPYHRGNRAPRGGRCS